MSLQNICFIFLKDMIKAFLTRAANVKQKRQLKEILEYSLDNKKKNPDMPQINPLEDLVRTLGT